MISLPNLIVLKLSRNQIKKIEGLEMLTSLEVLYLTGNQIEKVEGLEAQSQSLKVLWIYSNKISDESALSYLGNTLKKLENLGIDDNPVCPGNSGNTTSEFAKKAK